MPAQPIQPVTPLQSAIATSYEVFAQYPNNARMEASPLHDDRIAEWTAVLQAAPMPALSAGQLNTYVGKAMTTWGSVEDFKHYLPRILELTAQWDAPYAAFIVFGKLEYGNWHAWPTDEVKAIEGYLLAVWTHLLQDDSEKAEWQFKEYLQGIFALYGPVQELVAVWSKDQSQTATYRLADFIYNGQTEIFGKEGRGGKGYDPILVTWLLSDAVLTRLEAAFYQFEQEEIATTISWAEKVLRDQRYNAGIV